MKVLRGKKIVGQGLVQIRINGVKLDLASTSQKFSCQWPAYVEAHLLRAALLKY